MNKSIQPHFKRDLAVPHFEPYTPADPLPVCLSGLAPPLVADLVGFAPQKNRAKGWRIPQSFEFWGGKRGKKKRPLFPTQKEHKKLRKYFQTPILTLAPLPSVDLWMKPDCRMGKAHHPTAATSTKPASNAEALRCPGLDFAQQSVASWCDRTNVYSICIYAIVQYSLLLADCVISLFLHNADFRAKN